MEYISVQTASKKWGLTEQRITKLCREGRIADTKKEGGNWLIPKNANRPVDGRIRNKNDNSSLSNRPFPLGISSYREAVTKYYYVDKTLMIKDFLDSIPKVSLFTRPRRFGKTLNMDMIRTFFEISEEDTSVYFKDKKIWECGEKYRVHQGKYPVIFLSFKDVKFDDWKKAYKCIADCIAVEYLRHSELRSSEKCDQTERNYYSTIVSRKADEVELTRALSSLSAMLYKHYGEKTIIIIDEYDTPIQQGYIKGYYDQLISFIRNLFSGAFKDNEFLEYGFLTGILRVAKESIFSGLNNLKEHSILDERFSEYFGFTFDEVKEMLRHYVKTNKFKEICDWFDGYRFGETDIFNPWSVISYLDSGCVPRAYWQSTGNNDIIGEIVKNATPEISENLQTLMRGESIQAYIDSSIIYPEIQKNPSSVYSFLLMAGYLKIADTDNWQNGELFSDIKIPNKEISSIYSRGILSFMSDIIPQSSAISIQQAILKRDTDELKLQLERFLLQTVSSFDISKEVFYHGLMLGIASVLNNLYIVTSNRESGNGRFDIQLKPIGAHMPGFLIELKILQKEKAGDNITEKLRKLAKEAVEQINSKQYDVEMKSSGVEIIIKMGIAFCKRQVEIIVEE